MTGSQNREFAAGYDDHRPAPPSVLLDALTRMASVERPSLVVDLGSGTGLSTRAWADRAVEVIGVEPSADMRSVAEERTREWNVRYLAASASETGLPEACADVVTCSQSLHWMEPEPTFTEVARILRPGGVFAAYDYDPVPVVHPELDAAFADVLERAKALRRERGLIAPWTSRPPLAKSEHLDRMRASGHFGLTRELVFHSAEESGADGLLGLLRSYGAIEMYRDEEELGLRELEAAARRVLGERTVTFWLGYRVRVGLTP